MKRTIISCFGDLDSLDFTVEAGGQNSAERFRQIFTREAGKLTTLEECFDGQCTTFTYTTDAEGRLLRVFPLEANPALSATFTYDANGNRLTRDGEDGLEGGAAFFDTDQITQYANAVYTHNTLGQRTQFDGPGQLDLHLRRHRPPHPRAESRI